jgi:hypothetical protein
MDSFILPWGVTRHYALPVGLKKYALAKGCIFR